MRVLYSANAMDKFGDGYDRISILKYLRRLGHDVTVDESPKSTEGYDLFIGIVSCGCKLSQDIVRKSKCPTILWNVDDGIRFEMFKGLMMSADYMYSIDKSICDKYNNVLFLPPASDHEVCINKNIPINQRKHKISFIGNCSYPTRKELIRRLSEEFGANIAVFGWQSPQEGRNREYSFTEMVDIFNESVINVDATHHGVINNRAYDVPMCGGLLLSDAKWHMNKSCPYIQCDDVETLISRCRILLRRTDIHEWLSDKKHKLIKNETWENRVKQILRYAKS